MSGIPKLKIPKKIDLNEKESLKKNRKAMVFREHSSKIEENYA